MDGIVGVQTANTGYDGGIAMKIVFYGTREYDHYYFDVLAADPEYGCEIRFLTANLDADTAPLAQGGDAVCAFVNADCSAPVLEKLAQVGIRCLLLRCAGYNNVDLAAAQKCGITVLRVPGYSPEAVAEHAMALAQAANRRICKAYIKVRNNNFALDGLLGYNLYGSSAGIVGTGRIGAAMARICHGFGMTVLAYDQYRNPALDGIVRYVELDELLRTADLISLHCPLTAETHHIINADTIKMMRDNAILVNTSRGGLIDTNALIDALRARKFAGVGLDVYEDEDGQVFEDFSDDVLQNEVVPILMSFPNVGRALLARGTQRQPQSSRVDDEHRPLQREGGFPIRPDIFRCRTRPRANHVRPYKLRKVNFYEIQAPVTRYRRHAAARQL